MSDFEPEESVPPKAKPKGRGVFYAIAIYLIGKFLWRVTVTTNYFLRPSEVYLGITFDVLAVIGLMGLKWQLAKAVEEGRPEWTSGQQVLYWLALAAGLLALRFSHHGWWTGHLFFELSLRPR